MATESPVSMVSEIGARSMVGSGGGEGFAGEDLEAELTMYRSGSAPPTVEGSLTAVGGASSGFGFASEEEIRSDPDYVSYYYTHVKLNPRLPPPTLSKEEWVSTKRVVGGIGDRRKPSRVEEGISNLGLAGEWSCRGDGLMGLSLEREKSFADILQDDLGPRSDIFDHLSHVVKHDALVDGVEPLHSTEIRRSINSSSSSSHTFASVVGSSLSRSKTPDPEFLPRAPSPGLPPVGVRISSSEKSLDSSASFNRVPSNLVESDDVLAALSCLNLQRETTDHQNFLFDSQDGQNHVKQMSFSDLNNSIGGRSDLRNSGIRSKQIEHHMPANLSSRSYQRTPALHQKFDGLNGAFTSYGPSGYPINPSIPSNMLNQSVGVDLTSTLGVAAEYTARAAANYSDPSFERDFMGNSYSDILDIQKAYIGALRQPQKQYGMPLLTKSASFNHGQYGNGTFGPGMSTLARPVASPAFPGSPVRLGERGVHCFPSGLRNVGGSVMGSWPSDPNGNIKGNFSSSLLEEFKNNKTGCFELAEIVGHVVEFSSDQYGSRFIQQKLETATAEEKDMVFEEIMPHALSLMTDVFGNYVVQKFFEHGSVAQRRELAEQLNGHVLALSLQMYGCRVIQKAIEVIDLDQKTKLVTELDGQVMRCVRDQNGNHVVQKCIECIPEGSIQFIISTFYNQVVTLSTHPYGCRVIQRVLEHCNDPKTQQIVMGEILQSVCMLAQDQYGNYVVQHVLEHGKPEERSIIIEKLAGQIVQMSQQKFASNVVEKCLTFGGPAERQILINEMLGTTDENEPLQAMMKDQFANYVVQKVLETCNDQQRELILSRIKVHLNALKKYTYGKHIVARVEKLIAAGERRIGLQSPYPS
uniref:PUM-HD domain-containing protein n=1 Tax=Ananas comosus var. bracteatus TaxID=296719 RepID=A0A6V7NGB5_ANACO|nr:unnamed protein product [Ananas comosus var. bracteatus]